MIKTILVTLICLVHPGLGLLKAAPAGEKIDLPETVEVEGVGSSRHSAPIAALREVGQRLLGRPFSVVYGKHIAFGEDLPSPPIDTRRKRIIDIEKLKSGLYKAIIEVKVPEGAPITDQILRERLHCGKSELRSGLGLLSIRKEAIEAALESAIQTAVIERYPGNSAPNRLIGRAFFLGTVREEIEGGNYVVMARVKVRLVEP